MPEHNSDNSKHASTSKSKSDSAVASANANTDADSVINMTNSEKFSGVQTSVQTSIENKPSLGFYLIPNFITTCGLFAGFYAIMQARLGHFEAACVAVYVSMIMDILDGRLARLMNTMSEFGSQYDSLADMVSFGVAPALVLYEWSMNGMGKLGSLVAFVYIACAALRLARFNVMKSTDKKYFLGLASPAAAVVVISAMYVAHDYNFSPEKIAPFFCVLVFFAGILMVSNVKYRSFKDFDIKDKVPFLGLIILVLVLAAIYLDPPVAFLMLSMTYFLSGVIEYVWHNWVKARG